MAKAKPTTETTNPEEGLGELNTTEVTPTEVSSIILNEPAPAKEDSGYGSRDFHNPINQG